MTNAESNAEAEKTVQQPIILEADNSINGQNSTVTLLTLDEKRFSKLCATFVKSRINVVMTVTCMVVADREEVEAATHTAYARTV